MKKGKREKEKIKIFLFFIIMMIIDDDDGDELYALVTPLSLSLKYFFTSLESINIIIII